MEFLQFLLDNRVQFLSLWLLTLISTLVAFIILSAFRRGFKEIEIYQLERLERIKNRLRQELK